MKLLKKIRKGFTLIELVVVIAVIAILAAVSVVSYVSITNKAKESNDHMMIDQINLSVEGSSIPSRKATLHEVLEDLKEDAGFGVEKLTPELKDAEFVYSYSMNKFAYWKKDKVVYPKDVAESSSATGEDLWFFKDVQSGDSLGAGRSYYVKSAPANATITVRGGIDVGSQSFSSINYLGGDSAKEVVIRTSSALTTLTINAPLDTVHHYDTVGKVNIDKIDMNCYYEKGHAAYVKVTEGKVVAKDGGKIEVAFAANLDGTKVAIIEEAGKVETGYTVVQPVSDANVQRKGGIQLTYSIDGEHAASATQEQINAATNAIEATGELSVASETGVQPAGMDFTAVVRNVGYNSLTEAIAAAQAGDTVSLLKDYNTDSERILVNKAITINGNNHIINNTRAQSAFAPYNSRSGRDAAIYVTASATFNKLTLKTTKSCYMHIPDSTSNITVNINDCDFEAPSNKYGFVAGNYANYLDVKIKNSTLAGWCAMYLKCHHSSFLIENSKLCGINGTSVTPSNGFGTIVIDTNGGFDDQTSTPQNEGCYNTLTIRDCDIYANTDTSAGANVEIWLVIQYRAHHNTVNMTGNIFSTNPINPSAGWEYHHHTSGNDDDVQATNTVTVNGTPYYGFPSNHD